MLTLNDKSLLKSKNYINGQWVTGGDGTIEVLNPATSAAIISIAHGNAVDATQAVEAAAI